MKSAVNLLKSKCTQPAVDRGEGLREKQQETGSLPALRKIMADARKNAQTFVTEWTSPGGGE
ncbi:MAG: hypothetical protein HYZ53_12040 [Planctomycetes bacterium]|nr:hypothetical protein [Planctomycetota bacterium]